MELGNTQTGDGGKYRGAGAVQITGRTVYEAFSEEMNDPKIIEDGAVYVGQKYFWESGGYYWGIFKPGSANDDRFDLNKKSLDGADARKITTILNGSEDNETIDDRQEVYEYYIYVLTHTDIEND